MLWLSSLVFPLACVLVLVVLVSAIARAMGGGVGAWLGSVIFGALLVVVAGPALAMGYVFLAFWEHDEHKHQEAIEARKFHLTGGMNSTTGMTLRVNVTLEGPDGKRWSDTGLVGVTIDYEHNDTGLGSPDRWRVNGDPLRLQAGGRVYLSHWVARDVVDACIPAGTYKDYGELYNALERVSGPCKSAAAGTFLAAKDSGRPGLAGDVRVVDFVLAAKNMFHGYIPPVGPKGPADHPQDPTAGLVTPTFHSVLLQKR